MASDAVRLLFIIMMIKACYYQQDFILSRAALQSHAIVSSKDNDRADSHSRKVYQNYAPSCVIVSIMHHHASSCIIMHHHASSCIIMHHHASSSCIIISIIASTLSIASSRVIMHHHASSCICHS
jgi:hypothetical protein